MRKEAIPVKCTSIIDEDEDGNPIRCDGRWPSKTALRSQRKEYKKEEQKNCPECGSLLSKHRGTYSEMTADQLPDFG